MAQHPLNSGIIQVYVVVTIISLIEWTIVTGDVVISLFVAGWIGLFAAIIVNELTPGYTMDGIRVVR